MVGRPDPQPSCRRPAAAACLPVNECSPQDPRPAAGHATRRAGWSTSQALSGRRGQAARDGLPVQPPSPVCLGRVPCTKGHQFYECLADLAFGEDEGGQFEVISEQRSKVWTRTMERASIGAAHQEYGRFDLVTAMPMVPYAVPDADILQDVNWRRDWSTPVDLRSTAVYRDGWGDDAAWPELCCSGQEGAQMSADSARGSHLRGLTWQSPDGRLC